MMRPGLDPDTLALFTVFAGLIVFAAGVVVAVSAHRKGRPFPRLRAGLPMVVGFGTAVLFGFVLVALRVMYG